MSLALTTTARQEAMLEFSSLAEEDHCPLGVYCYPSSTFEWACVIFVHRGYYAGAVLHFRLQIPPSYPAAAPAIIFDSQLFHPLVDPVSGRMRLDSRFPTWRPRQDGVSKVLHFVKASMKRRTLDGLREAVCANQEAYRLYRTQPTLFAKLASQSASLSFSSSALYTPPTPRSEASEPTPIRFRRLETGEEARLKERVREEGERKVVRRPKGSTGSAASEGY
ncbi:hypothetical protein JCM10213_009330 [Rhodosporidiobolus nylandii]